MIKFLGGEDESHIRALELCYDFNRLRPTDPERVGILKSLIPHIGWNVQIKSPFYCDYGSNIEIGDNFFSNYNLTILDSAKVKFGNNVLIAPNCGFYTISHPISAEERNRLYGEIKPITVGNNVWIGASSIILQGVTIGDNSVIAAGSVVKYDVPPNVIVAGNPARIVKQIKPY